MRLTGQLNLSPTCVPPRCHCLIPVTLTRRQALRHSKVKLAWDEDDPERNHVLRRPLTKKEMEEADFRAYIASSSSEGSEDEGDEKEPKETGHRNTKDKGKTSKMAERDKLRMLLLGGDDDELSEGWGNAFDDKGSRGKKSRSGGGEDSDVDMEVTFMPGLSETKNTEDENTLERYQRKQKEKRKKKKEEAKKRTETDVDDDDVSMKKKPTKSSFDDEFFGAESDGEHEKEEPSPNQSRKRSTKPTESSAAELALLAASDNPHGEPTHFDMKAVLKAEKRAKSKKSKHKSKKRKDDADDGPGETQEDFVIDVKDERFAAIHEDHQFAIDPTNPQ